MMAYDEYRTGLSFSDVRRMVAEESVRRYEREGQCIRITRKRILGKWRQNKREGYAHYVRRIGGPGA